jgi:hypothetical protein
MVERLNEITRATGAVIVVSSTWRICNEAEFARLIDYLKQEGVEAEIIGRTPRVPSRRTAEGHEARGIEIQDWLDENPVDKFVILDDDSDMEHLMPYLVHTTWNDGISEENVAEAIALLKVA